MAERLVDPSAIVLLPPEANTLGLVREHLELDRLQAENPAWEYFALAFKFWPESPFAVVFRVRKDVVHIQQGGLPYFIDPVTRLGVVYPSNQVPIGEGRVG